MKFIPPGGGPLTGSPEIQMVGLSLEESIEICVYRCGASASGTDCQLPTADLPVRKILYGQHLCAD